MSETPSNMLPLHTKAPDFYLKDTVSGKRLSLDECKSDIATVVMFLCNHCPYVKHIQEKLVAVAKSYQQHGIAFVAISSNDVENYPLDAPELMTEEANINGYTFPYLYDEDQSIAKAYQAACTPDFYIFDKNLLCVYRGRFDNSTPYSGKPVTGAELTSALDSILNNKPVSAEQIPSLGCNIKWK